VDGDEYMHIRRKPKVDWSEIKLKFHFIPLQHTWIKVDTYSSKQDRIRASPRVLHNELAFVVVCKLPKQNAKSKNRPSPRVLHN